MDPDVYHYDISADFWLNAHNEVYRPRHRSPPVQWDEFLASQAQAWCEVQAQRLTPQMLKPQHPAMGEEREHFLSDTQGDYAGQNLAVVVTPTPGLDPAHARHVANAAAAQIIAAARADARDERRGAHAQGRGVAALPRFEGGRGAGHARHGLQRLHARLFHIARHHPG